MSKALKPFLELSNGPPQFPLSDIRRRKNQMRRRPKSANDMHPVNVKIGHDDLKA
ncbi:unnamed protein product, partial [marine sediment metagenome]